MVHIVLILNVALVSTRHQASNIKQALTSMNLDQHEGMLSKTDITSGAM